METQEAGLKTVNNTYMESHRILRTPSALVRDALLYIQEIGEMVCKEPRQNWRNSLDSYLLNSGKRGLQVRSQLGKRRLPCRLATWLFWTVTIPIPTAVMQETPGIFCGCIVTVLQCRICTIFSGSAMRLL